VPLELRILVCSLGVVLLVVVGGLVALHLRPHWFRGLERESHSVASDDLAHRAPARPTSVSTTNLPSTPVLDSIAPEAGSAGGQLTLVGTGFFSASGSVVATFDAKTVPTACPSEQRCVATIPSEPGSTAVVEIETSSATSNAMIFTYRSPATAVSPTAATPQERRSAVLPQPDRDIVMAVVATTTFLHSATTAANSVEILLFSQ
jgi:hypothetical protein